MYVAFVTGEKPVRRRIERRREENNDIKLFYHDWSVVRNAIAKTQRGQWFAEKKLQQIM